MLLEFRVANYRSFDEEQTLSLVASRDKSHENANVTRESGMRVLKAAAVYGGNASGKTNLTLAFDRVRRFVSASATEMTLGDEIDIEPFCLSSASVTRPSMFHFAMWLDGTRFDYGLGVTRERVHSESIVAYPEGRPQRWLERYYDPKAGEYEWHCRGPLAKEKRGLAARTRSNGLALSRGVERNIQALAPLFLWFKNKCRVLDQSVQPDSPRSIMPYSLDLFGESKAFRAYLTSLITDADMGIVNLDVIHKTLTEEDLPPDLPPGMRARLLAQISGRPLMTWVATHVNRSTQDIGQLFVNQEAMGTQRLLALGGPWWDCLQNGYTLVVDELDCSLHPHLVRKLVEVFQSPLHNPNGAQLVFTTHDSTLMDLTLMRRDQIWLTEKLPSGASSLYSLYDFAERPRRDEAVQRRYLGGRYGGVPFFGPTLEPVD